MENGQLASTLSAEQAKVARLNDCVKYLQDGAKVTQTELDTLTRERTAELERKGEELKTSINERDNEIERLKTEAEAVTTEVENIKQKSVDEAVASTRFNELTTENERLSSLLIAEQAKVTRLNDCVKYLQDGAKAAQTEIDNVNRERTAELEAMKLAMTAEVEDLKRNLVDNTMASNGFNELTTENERLASALSAEQANVARLNDCIKYLQHGARVMQTDVNNLTKEQSAELERKGEELRTSIHEKDSEIERLKAELEGVKLAMVVEVENLQRTRDELEILQQANAPSPDVVELSLALVSEQTKTAALEIEKSRAVALSNSFVIGLSELKEMLNSRDEEITELRKARDAKIAENDRLCAERDAFEGTGPRRVNEIVDLLAELRAQEVIQLHQRNVSVT
ncbi:hypothetical protein BDP27DRAFT_612764 [Rhodocollybia butyracea]|uniref:Uncharacterized protein n=1 Tax=Rhodocollybia butyracea TaxID=206335 RepID=A0A9P5PYQ8_9AGAR|nr:hypothetical protein BDP27DRAFT_612764 [Rhodocollybia butyracea]